MYAIDLLGFGESEKAPIDYSMELWRDLILDFMSEYVKEPVVLVGNSIGSLAALMVMLLKQTYTLVLIKNIQAEVFVNIVNEIHCFLVVRN